MQRAQIDPLIRAKLQPTVVWKPRTGRGRPPTYHQAFLELAYNLTLLGCVDEDLARVFEVSRETIVHWFANKPGFAEAVKAGKDQADSRVVRALFQRAIGYDVTETKIFYDKE